MATWNEYDIYVQNGNRVLLWGTVYDEETAKEYSQTLGGWYKVRLSFALYPVEFVLDTDASFGV